MIKWRRLKRRTHPMWHIMWLSAGTLVGISLSAIIKTNPFIGWHSLVLIIGLMIISLVNRRLPLLVLALVAGLILGLWRGGAEQQALQAYQPYFGKTITLSGLVSEDATINASGQQQLRLTGIQISDQVLKGSVWLSGDSQPGIKRGDRLTVQGKLMQGFGNVPASMFQAKLVAVERPVPGDVARRVRDWFANGIRRAIPGTPGDLSVGYLVGQKSALPDTLMQQLKTVGLTHAVVASGYNLTILVGFARRLLARFSKYLAALAASLMIGGFVLITGLSPSMSRAGLVSLLSLIAWYYGRSIHPIVLLTFSAALTAVWRPAYVWGDIGWYLSFTAFTGVIILAPLIKRYFFGKQQKLGVLRQTLLDTTAAQLLTLPIILHVFGQYATYALIANVLVLPLVPLAMLLTFVAGAGGLGLPQFAEWFGWPARMILISNIWVIDRIARCPGASGEVNFGIRALVLSYVVLIMIMFYLWRMVRFNFRETEDDTSLTVF